MTSPFDVVTFSHGPAMKNRFMLAPLTNEQSHADGTLSDEEYRWLTYRAEGGFGLTMTCASHVQRVGQAFTGQLGCYSDDHLPGLTRLAAGIKEHGSLAIISSTTEDVGPTPSSSAPSRCHRARTLMLVLVR